MSLLLRAPLVAAAAAGSELLWLFPVAASGREGSCFGMVRGVQNADGAQSSLVGVARRKVYGVCAQPGETTAARRAHHAPWPMDQYALGNFAASAILSSQGPNVPAVRDATSDPTHQRLQGESLPLCAISLASSCSLSFPTSLNPTFDPRAPQLLPVLGRGRAGRPLGPHAPCTRAAGPAAAAALLRLPLPRTQAAAPRVRVGLALAQHLVGEGAAARRRAARCCLAHRCQLGVLPGSSHMVSRRALWLHLVWVLRVDLRAATTPQADPSFQFIPSVAARRASSVGRITQPAGGFAVAGMDDQARCSGLP